MATLDVVKKNQIWIPILTGIIVSVVYGFRYYLNQFIPNSYFVTLFSIPILLILLKKFSFFDLGFRVGNPPVGLFFMFLLPGVLFLRYYLTKVPMRLTDGYLMFILGSWAEEFFFRGYLQEEFNKFLGKTFGFTVTNFFFMLVHVVKGYSLLSSLVIFAIGIYFSFTKDKEGGNSLVYSMGAHSFYNLIAASAVRVGRMF